MPNSSVEEERPILCPSDTYGEYGKLQVICALSASLLGMQADKNKAIVIGRKVTIVTTEVVVVVVVNDCSEVVPFE